MVRWIFAGAADKRDLLLYICKVLASSGHRVLLIDATDRGKYRYVIGGISGGKEIIEFNGFDFVRAGSEMEEPQSWETYDYCLYDVNHSIPAGRHLWSEAGQVVWVASYDRYEIAGSCEFFSRLFERWPQLSGMKVRPVFTRAMDTYVDERYVMTLMEQLPIDWMEANIRIPFDEINVAVQTENEHSQTLRMNRITRAYKRAITDLISQLAGWEFRTVQKALRKAERRQA
ncbi:hypothetical protein [Paenibacillus woosongensis]|uniref:Uncharacterized protein n=1 Tax=Paenibacillus woosongensis TaxID=307580 RepID=A0A7X2Z5V0_9BACL|nr:hypothetical protein [Paenibacillus woosongensis]MUG47543.1 hypothetical protein [Paenibacillus woosongensis]